MIIVENRSDETPVRIVARGNFSLNANGMAVVLLVLGVVTLGLAGFLALNGYWPVLVFAVIQLVLVAGLLIHVWHNAWVFEEIQIDSDQIRVIRQKHRNQSHHCLESAWAKIRVEQPHVPWYASRLILRSKNQELELGAFLTNDEKLSLAKHLANALSAHSAWGSR